MKLTPEQKAFFEYGKAFGELKRYRSEFIFAQHIYRGLKKNEAIFLFRKRLLVRNKLIKDAWQKRAVCRVWTPPEGRDCPNCKYHGLWEPRKEGE